MVEHENALKSNLLAALRWQMEAGADEAVLDYPIDRTALAAGGNRRAETAVPGAQGPASDRRAAAPPDDRSTPATPDGARPTPDGARPTPDDARPPTAARSRPDASTSDMPLGTAEAVQAARHAAQAAGDLDALREAIAGFEGLSMKHTASNMVFADGQPGSRLMLIGEAPGKEEDRQGLPFVGQSGQLLDRMLAAIGHDRNSVYITNILNWRPPGNRKPAESEITIAEPFIQRHIALAGPEIIVLLGDTAAKSMLKSSQGITRLRGRWQTLSVPDVPGSIRCMPTFHPAFLLRSAAQKRYAWRDVLAVHLALKGLN